MERVKFNRCLNKEKRYYHISSGSLFGALISFFLVTYLKSMMWGALGAGLGFILGGQVSSMWFKGSLQRYLYWNMNLYLSSKKKSSPSSHYRNLI